MLLSRKRRSALLVDFDNVVSQTGSLLADAISNWLAWLEDGGFDPKGTRRDFVVKRVYWNVANDTAHRLKFKKHKFETRLCRAVRNKDKGSSADFDITIDAVELRRERPRLQEVVILSYDSDFLTVLNHLQVHDIAVVGMAKGDDRPARAFREMTDHVIEHEAFLAACAYKRVKPRLLASSSRRPKSAPPDDREPAPAKATPSPKPAEPAKTAAPAAAPADVVAAAAPAAKKSIPRKRPRRKATKSAASHLTTAVEIVAKAATSSPSANLSKRFVCRALENFDGFCTSGSGAWLGCTNYPAMIRKFAASNSAFEIAEQRNGGINLVYRGPEAGPSP